MKRTKPPLPSKATGPERVRLAMQICHQWQKLSHSQWGESAPTSSGSTLLRRLHHIHEGALLWGTSTPPPPVGSSWAANDHTTWSEWALATVPAINRFLISSGVAHTHGTFCTHPIGNETRLQVGPSLGGALRPGGTNSMIDGLELPSTDDLQERWNCSDQGLRRHMALEIMKLSSDKTVPSKSTMNSTYPFTMAAKEILLDPGDDGPVPPYPLAPPDVPPPPGDTAEEDQNDSDVEDETEAPDPREPPYMPSAPHDARTRGAAKVVLLNSLHKDIEAVTRMSWTDHRVWPQLESIATRAESLGFGVPTWVRAMQNATTILMLRIDLHTHLDSQKNPANCGLTHILNRHPSSLALTPSPTKSLGTRSAAGCGHTGPPGRRPVATQSASMATHLERSSGSLSSALQPPSDPTGTQ